MTILALLVAIYAVSLLNVPAMREPFLRDRMARMPLAVYGHLAGGAVAIATGPIQFLPWLRRRSLNLHRWLGRVYLGGVLVAGLAGLTLARVSEGGLPAHLGFGLLAVLWLGTGAMAYNRIRHGEVASHRRWMIRCFALTLAAVTLRILLPLGQVAGMPYVSAYQLIAWACWVPNLALAEWWLRMEPRRLPVTQPLAPS